MAYHIFIVTSMLIAGLATSTLAAPSTPITVETCGISKPCGPNDTYTILCPASITCNEYYKCEKGVVSIQTCNKAFFLFWLAPVYDPATKCCKLVFSFCSPVRPDQNGLCPTISAEPPAIPAEPPAIPAEPAAIPAEPAAIPAEPAIDSVENNATAHVKRHASAESGVPTVQSAEPEKEPLKEEEKPVEPNIEATVEKKPDVLTKTENVPQESKPESRESALRVASSSASVFTNRSSAIVIIVLLNVFMRH